MIQRMEMASGYSKLIERRIHAHFSLDATLALLQLHVFSFVCTPIDALGYTTVLLARHSLYCWIYG